MGCVAVAGKLKADKHMIKVWPADRAFANVIKIAGGYTCQRCNTVYPPKHRGLHLSHHISRGNWSVRFEPSNAFIHCYGCHRWLGARPDVFVVWARQKLGDTRYEMLIDASRDLDRGRRARREKKDIAKHYRQQLRIMQSRRDKGELGNYMVIGYD